MNFRDRRVTCSNCGDTYIFTVTEQRRLSEAGQAVIDPDTGEIVPPDQCPTCRLRDPETGRYTGRVKWFSPEKGYGFIVKPDADEIFFHRSQVEDESLGLLDDGVSVSFEQAETDRGEEARQVKVESE
jgi:CspA family cold shock protein